MAWEGAVPPAPISPKVQGRRGIRPSLPGIRLPDTKYRKFENAASAQVESVNTRRRKVLWAIDRKWPCTDKANGAIRRAFWLSPDRAMQ